MRMKDCAARLQDLYDGKIDRIEELEEELLDNYFSMKDKFTATTGWRTSWSDTVTRSVISDNLFGW